MSQRIFLHVGAPKTGTSYIESIIWSQRQRVLDDGIWMPGTTRNDHDALMGEVRGGVWRQPDAEWTWERVVREGARRREDILISKEMLSGASAEAAATTLALLEPFEVHVIVAARQLAASLPSAWQQLVKARGRVPFDDWLDALRADPDHGFWRHHDPLSILDRWAPDFPADRVHVITMPRDASDPVELWRRFAGILGLDPTSYQTPERPRNESVGAVEIEMLRRVNVGLGPHLPMRAPYIQTVARNVTTPLLLGRPDRVRFGVPAKHADWLIERSAQMIDELEARPYEIVGDPEDLRATHQPGLISPSDVSEDEIAALSVEVLARLLINLGER